MLYSFLKIWVRLAAFIFCRKIIINQPDKLQLDGPLLIASNHPNSLLDALILCILFKKPIHSLARGDAFKKPAIAKLLTNLNILPVYRVREGVENLETNYETFAACQQLFKTNGIVLIFSEGLCVNEWHLRPLKKGTARLAVSAWQAGINLKVLPTGINHSSFTKFGKNIVINFGEIISSTSIDIGATDGKKHIAFNDKLSSSLQNLVFEIPTNSEALLQEKFSFDRPTIFKKCLFFLPSLLGLLLNAPLYVPLKMVALRLTKGTDHFDAVLTGLLTFSYPFYLLLLTLGLVFLGLGWYSLLAFILVPALARAYVYTKDSVG